MKFYIKIRILGKLRQDRRSETKLSLDVGGNHITGFKILLEDDENDSYFNRLSKELLIKNPAIEFADDAKAGVYNELSDEKYAAILEEVKLFCSIFQNESAKWEKYLNVFELLERLINVYLYCMIVEKREIDKNE